MTKFNIDHTGWETPTYNVLFWQQRRHNFCIIIPVVNEGHRIAKLLSRMAALSISHIADIIIVDGGSNDGSLNINNLKAVDVTGLLIKTGAGKLSAQLRCAYAFALERGYEGIITIDGNNKDDPQAIPGFIDALKEGVDFVQASRFIQGGSAENTPRWRYFAIRFVHAPLLSIASHFKWTDTTQGFRAYSSKLLLNREINIFRDIFVTYELLAYLSYRAPRLGFHCIEMPTHRCYPQGDIPTKIKGLRDNLRILLILFKVCLGFYNPSRSKR